MELGFIGLGRMGQAMVLSLMARGHRVICYDVSPEAVARVAAAGAGGTSSLKELAGKLSPPRSIWLMVPAGPAVDEVIFDGLFRSLKAGDTVIDGGNSNYKDSIRRSEQLRERGIHFLDVGTSGGLEGAATGLSLMVAGEKAAFHRLQPIFESLAAPGGYGYVGKSGAGHFVKTVHNGIEYAMLQAYGEGFELLKEGPFDLDLPLVARIWNGGGVVRSWLLGLIERALAQDPQLEGIAPQVGGGETGRWAVEAALENQLPFMMIGMALSMRFATRREESFAAKLVAALRREFGGHPVTLKETPPQGS